MFIYLLKWVLLLSLGKYPKNISDGLYCSSIFNFLRNLNIVFTIDYIYLQFHSQDMRIPLSSVLLIKFCCCLVDNSHSDRWEVISHCRLICISLMINNVECLFRYLLAICMSSLENCLFRAFLLFNQVVCGVFYLFLFVLSVELYNFFIYINPLLDVQFVNIFYSVGCLFVLLIVSFTLWKIFSSM